MVANFVRNVRKIMFLNNKTKVWNMSDIPSKRQLFEDWLKHAYVCSHNSFERNKNGEYIHQVCSYRSLMDSYPYEMASVEFMWQAYQVGCAHGGTYD